MLLSKLVLVKPVHSTVHLKVDRCYSRSISPAPWLPLILNLFSFTFSPSSTWAFCIAIGKNHHLTGALIVIALPLKNSTLKTRQSLSNKKELL